MRPSYPRTFFLPTTNNYHSNRPLIISINHFSFSSCDIYFLKIIHNYPWTNHCLLRVYFNNTINEYHSYTCLHHYFFFLSTAPKRFYVKLPRLEEFDLLLPFFYYTRLCLIINSEVSTTRVTMIKARASIKD